MAKYEDYITRGEDGLDREIDSAQVQQQERARDPETGQFVANDTEAVTSTPDVNWQDRYSELEKHNSRQAQNPASTLE